MRRDMELVRQVLFKVEELPFDGGFHDIAVEGHSEEDVSYHVMLLREAGLLEASNLSSLDGISWKPIRLTYAGHEFIDSVRSDNFWHRVKQVVIANVGSLSVEALKTAIPIVLKSAIEQR